MKFVQLGAMALAGLLITAPITASLAGEDPPMETRIGEEGFASPPATLKQMDWLVGQWAGEGIRGGPAMESWLPPVGGTMVGTFVQEVSDETGTAIMFTEHLYLSEQDGSLVLKLKHFNADLTGWEEKDDMLTFRLVAIEPCAAYFNALTLRCADRERPGEGLVAAVRMQSGGELLFRFEAMEHASQSASCSDSVSTPEMNSCFSDVFVRSEERRKDYLAAAVDQNSQMPEIAQKISASGQAFEAYRDAECEAVRESFKGGTIVVLQILTCKTALNDQRSHTIWQNWLTYMDSTPPVLPEPKPTM